MRRILLILAFLLLACRILNPLAPTYQPTIPSAVLTTATIPPETALPSPTFSPTSTKTPSPTQPPKGITPTIQPGAFNVRYHPDGGLYVGDLVSMEVLAPRHADLGDRKINIQIGGHPEVTLEPVKFDRYGIEGRNQATLYWAWNTNGTQPGPHVLTFSIEPGGPTWTETVTLQPEASLPPPEPDAQWASAESQCCVLYYITDTAAERDLPSLLELADEQAASVSSQFGISFTEPITLTLLPRVLGHGGFTDREISVSYLDNNYAGTDFSLVLHHEMVHVLDERLGGDLRPTMLVEGLAVYLTGGHYKPEELIPRAAALLEIDVPQPDGDPDWYLPIIPLADQFYPAQHEIGYLEAGALVQYMVERWGWEAFSAFYRDIHPRKDGSQSKAIDDALQKHFEISFASLEEDFLEDLKLQEVTEDIYQDVRLTVVYYETMRHYQQLLDPSAYFRTAWLLDNNQMRERGIVADYLRHPSTPENETIEGLLVKANQRVRAGRFTQAQEILEAIDTRLQEIEQPFIEAFSMSPLYLFSWQSSQDVRFP
jgi:hypothetical protein